MKWILLFKRNEMEILQNFQGLLEKVSTEKKLGKLGVEGMSIKYTNSEELFRKFCGSYNNGKSSVVHRRNVCMYGI